MTKLANAKSYAFLLMVDVKNQEPGIVRNANANVLIITALLIGSLTPIVNVSNNIVHLHLFHAQLVPNGILINANAFHKKYVFHQPEDALKAKNGIMLNVNANVFYLLLYALNQRFGTIITAFVNVFLQLVVVLKVKHGVNKNVHAYVVLQSKDVLQENNGIVLNANANVLNLQVNAYYLNNGIHKHALVSV